MINLIWNNTWIINTGTIDHMTNLSHHLTSIQLLIQLNILTTNRGVAHVTHKGSVSKHNSFTLDTIVTIPYLSYNLLYVSQITVALNCTVKF